MKLENLKSLFISELQDMYSAEQQMIAGLPKFADAAHDKGLKAVFESHLTQTEGHLERLSHVFTSIGEKEKAQKCEAMAGMIKEGGEILDAAKDGDPYTVDAALILGAQKEHYEICSYGTLSAYADVLGEHEAARLLRLTLEEEKATNRRLNNLAEVHINSNANHQDKDGNPKHHRVFFTAPQQDQGSRDRLINQIKVNGNVFINGLSHWRSGSEWEKECDETLKSCDAVIALITGNTPTAKDQLYVVSSARRERIPVHAMYMEGMDQPTMLPGEFTGLMVTTGAKESIDSFLDSLN